MARSRYVRQPHILVSTNVVGIKDLQGKFKKMAEDIGGAGRAEIAMAGAEVVATQVRENIRANNLIEEGHLIGSVEAFKVNQWTAGVAVGRGNEEAQNYAAVHEYGAKDVIITPKQRAYFKWRCSLDPGGVFCTLIHKDTYTIPARPYFRPALKQSRRAAVKEMESTLRDMLEKYGE